MPCLFATSNLESYRKRKKTEEKPKDVRCWEKRWQPVKQVEKESPFIPDNPKRTPMSPMKGNHHLIENREKALLVFFTFSGNVAKKPANTCEGPQPPFYEIPSAALSGMQQNQTYCSAHVTHAWDSISEMAIQTSEHTYSNSLQILMFLNLRKPNAPNQVSRNLSAQGNQSLHLR